MSKLLRITSILLAVLLFAANAQASIIYQVNETIGDGTVTGFIETDGTLGSITFANILDYELELTAPNFVNGSPGIIDRDLAASSYLQGNGLSATSTDLLFDHGGGGFVLFWAPSNTHFWCIESTGCAGLQGYSIGYGTSGSRAQELGMSGIQSFASTTSVPEPAVIALFGLGLAGLGWSRRRQAQ